MVNASFAALLAAGFLLHAADLSKLLAALDRERDPASLEAAAIAIARSGDAKAIGELGRHLGRDAFLQRLDPARGAESGTARLGRVFGAFAEHPSPASEALCIGLAGNDDFMSVPARLNFLLNALAAVRPMSAAAARVFGETSRSGYLEVNGPLLARNASPRALEALQELFADEALDQEQRVSMAHWSLLPRRTDVAIVAMCSRLVVSGSVSLAVRVAIIESLFDYQPRPWFGLAAHQPKPPDWKSAPTKAKELLRSLGKTLLARTDLSPGLRAAIRSTLGQLG